MNGKTGELLRWAMGLALAGVVSYYTALGAIRSDLKVLEERENNHYAELMQQQNRSDTEIKRQLDRLERKLDFEVNSRWGFKP